MKKGMLFFILFLIVGFLVSKIVGGNDKVIHEREYEIETIKFRNPVKAEEEKKTYVVLPPETLDLKVDDIEMPPDKNEPRDSLEWQGMRVPKLQPVCDGRLSCGMALVCLDGTCGPCKKDEQCGARERCVLQHCVLSEKVSCKTRDDCEEEDALCVLSGYSFGIRGNADMTAYCQSSSDLEEPLPDPEERRIFDKIRGPYEAADFEYSDLSKGLKYE